MDVTEWLVAGLMWGLAMWGLIRITRTRLHKEPPSALDRKFDDSAMDSIRSELDAQQRAASTWIRRVK